jgi:hypothetical protein
MSLTGFAYWPFLWFFFITAPDSLIWATGYNRVRHAQRLTSLSGEIDSRSILRFLLFIFTRIFRRCLFGRKHAGVFRISRDASVVSSLFVFVRPDLLPPIYLVKRKRAGGFERRIDNRSVFNRCSGSKRRRCFDRRAIEFHSGANPRAESLPEAYIEVHFLAPAGRCFVWLRSKNDVNSGYTDSVWLQVDDQIGTSTRFVRLGNWLDVHPPGVYGWASDRHDPVAIELKCSGDHKIRIQPRQTPHRIDQIWLSRSQHQIPNTSRPIK